MMVQVSDQSALNLVNDVIARVARKETVTLSDVECDILQSVAGQKLLRAGSAGSAAAVDETIAAVITSAVTVALQGRRFRIKNMRPSVPGAGAKTMSAWTQYGRQRILTSHAFERKLR